jgi:hypothetical protein
VLLVGGGGVDPTITDMPCLLAEILDFQQMFNEILDFRLISIQNITFRPMFDKWSVETKIKSACGHASDSQRARLPPKILVSYRPS